MNISIVIPVYNEEKTILIILEKIKKVEEKLSKNFSFSSLLSIDPPPIFLLRKKFKESLLIL